MLIFLVGFMGCGKSTIGRRVAGRLGYGFVDTDTAIEQREGMSVSEIFARRGERDFREMERGLLNELPPDGDLIVATGGGMPCHDGNMETMNCKGRVVYFRMGPEMLFARLERGRSRRPKLTGMSDEEMMEYIRTTLARREPFYSRASMIIDCNGVSYEYIASHISRFIENIPE